MSLRVVRIYCSVFVMLLTLATGAAHASPLLVAAQRDGSLVTLDPLTGGITSTIGSLGTVRVTGLAFDPLTGVLFGNTGGLGSVLDSLVTIDLTTAAVTVIGSLQTRMPDIAFDANGTLFGIRPHGALFTINTSTAAATAIGVPTIVGSGNGLEFGLDGTLYFAPSSITAAATPQLAMLNPTTGQSTGALALSMPLPVVPGLTTDPVSGALFALSGRPRGPEVDLVRIDPGTGVTTFVGTTGQFDAIAFQPTSVPEPDATWLLLIGLAAAILLTKACHRTKAFSA